MAAFVLCDIPHPHAALLRLCCHAVTSDRSQPTARPPSLRRAGKFPSFSIMYRVVRQIPVSCRHSASRITLSAGCWDCLILFIKKCSRSLRFESILIQQNYHRDGEKKLYSSKGFTFIHLYQDNSFLILSKESLLMILSKKGFTV